MLNVLKPLTFFRYTAVGLKMLTLSYLKLYICRLKRKDLNTFLTTAVLTASMQKNSRCWQCYNLINATAGQAKTKQ